jgi:CheY-like chemotaxis protein
MPDFTFVYSSVIDRAGDTVSLAPTETAPHRGTILVIEDRDDVRQGLAQLLELHGFLVADACDGTRALQELADDPQGIALILLDLVLPGSISGADVRARQLADPTLAAIPTIVLTASDTPPSDRAALHTEAWLEKPFKFDDLLEVVKRYVVPEAGGVIATE